MYHILGNVISVIVGLVYIKLQANMSFLARLVSDNSRSLENFELGALSPQNAAKETISARGLTSCS